MFIKWWMYYYPEWERIESMLLSLESKCRSVNRGGEGMLDLDFACDDGFELLYF